MQGRITMQNDDGKLEKWPEIKKVYCSKDEYKVLLLGGAYQLHTYRVRNGGARQEFCRERIWWGIADHNMRVSSVLLVNKANTILGCMKKRRAIVRHFGTFMQVMCRTPPYKRFCNVTSI